MAAVVPVVWSSDLNTTGILMMANGKAFLCHALDQGGQRVSLTLQVFIAHRNIVAYSLRKTTSPPLNCKDHILLSPSLLLYSVMPSLPPLVREAPHLLFPQLPPLTSGDHKVFRWPPTPGNWSPLSTLPGLFRKHNPLWSLCHF